MALSGRARGRVVLSALAAVVAACHAQRIEHVEAPRLGGLAPLPRDSQGRILLDAWAAMPEDPEWRKVEPEEPGDGSAVTSGAQEASEAKASEGAPEHAPPPAVAAAEPPESAPASAEPAEPLPGDAVPRDAAEPGDAEPEEPSPRAPPALGPPSLPDELVSSVALGRPSPGAEEAADAPLEPATEPASVEPILASELLRGHLADTQANVVAQVEDLLFDPFGPRLLGVVATNEALGEELGPFVPTEDFGAWEFGRIFLREGAVLRLVNELRAAETSALFLHREFKTYEGRIASEPKVEAEGLPASITLTEANNHRHRVLLAPPETLAGAPLTVDAQATVLALSIRAAQGPYLVAARITVGSYVLDLRDEAGRPVWAAPAQRPQGRLFREMLGRPVHVVGSPGSEGSEGAEGAAEAVSAPASGPPAATVADVQLDHSGGVEAIVLESEDLLLRVPWSALKRVSEVFALGEDAWQEAMARAEILPPSEEQAVPAPGDPAAADAAGEGADGAEQGKEAGDAAKGDAPR